MNGLMEQATTIAGKLRRGADGLLCDMAVCPPATMLHVVAHILVGSAVELGGQDCHFQVEGAYTGDISAMMLRDVGARWVILGHSERRASHGETNSIVRAKAEAASAAGLTPIICVGETGSLRIAGRHIVAVGEQLAGSLSAGFTGAVAYEPVWAIGTGRSATEAEVAEMHAFIRARLCQQLGVSGNAIRILYGGSVRPDNAAALLAIPEVGGALVGTASLDGEDFLAIARAAHVG